jgi:hypothetical protein
MLSKGIKKSKERKKTEKFDHININADGIDIGQNLILLLFLQDEMNTLYGNFQHLPII